MHFDLHDPAFRANPYPTYHRLRHCCTPIHYRPEKNDWIFTRYADMVAILKDNRFGYSDLTTTHAQAKKEAPFLTGPSIKAFRGPASKSEYLLNFWLIGLNPPEHTRLHKPLRRLFQPRVVAGWHARIEAIANQLIDQREALGAMDIIADFAYPLSATIIYEMLGLDGTPPKRLKNWSEGLAIYLDLETTPILKQWGLVSHAALAEYFQRHLAQRGQVAKNDMISALLEAENQGILSADEVLAHCIMLFFFGHASTQHLIGNGMYALFRHPEQLSLLQQNFELIPDATNEFLRYDSPVQLSTRSALTDVEINGKNIQKGQRVILLLGAANHDPLHFPNPEQFDITRRPNRHLSFGRGIHHCLGAQLARTLTEIAVKTLLRRLPNLALQTPDVEWGGLRTRGLKALPVVF